MIERLETPRLILRQPSPADWPAFRAFITSDRARFIGGPHDLGRAWRTFASELGHWVFHDFGMWTVTRRGDDTALGLVGPWCPADWPETEIGWMLFTDAVEGTGIATEAARAAITHAWEVLGWDTVVSYIKPENTRSIRLAERLGAVRDPDAPQPPSAAIGQVYRHPTPESLS